MYSFDKPKHKLYIIFFSLLFSTVLQMVAKFAGVQKCFTHGMKTKKKKDNMTLDESLLILANI